MPYLAFVLSFVLFLLDTLSFVGPEAMRLFWFSSSWLALKWGCLLLYYTYKHWHFSRLATKFTFLDTGATYPKKELWFFIPTVESTPPSPWYNNYPLYCWKQMLESQCQSLSSSKPHSISNPLLLSMKYICTYSLFYSFTIITRTLPTMVYLRSTYSSFLRLGSPLFVPPDSIYTL